MVGMFQEETYPYGGMYERARYDERELFERRGYPDLTRARADYLAPPLPRRDMPPLPTLGTRREPAYDSRPAAAFDGFTRRSPPAAARYGYVTCLNFHVIMFAWCTPFNSSRLCHVEPL